MIVVDGAQSAPHRPVDVQAIDADFFAFSGAQALRPVGRRRPLRPPRAARGDAAVPDGRRDDRRACEARGHAVLHWNEAARGSSRRARRRSPRSSAWAPPSSSCRVLGHGPGSTRTSREITPLRARAARGGAGPHGARAARSRTSAAASLSFSLEGVHPHDVAEILGSRRRSAMRAGHHCTQPVMERARRRRDDARVLPPLHHTRGSTAWSTGLLRRCSGIFWAKFRCLRRTSTATTSSTTTSTPRNHGDDRGRRRLGGGRHEPALRRPAHDRPEDRTTAASSRSASTARGCSISQAATSMLTELVEGKTVAEAPTQITADDVNEAEPRHPALASAPQVRAARPRDAARRAEPALRRSRCPRASPAWTRSTGGSAGSARTDAHVGGGLARAVSGQAKCATCFAQRPNR